MAAVRETAKGSSELLSIERFKQVVMEDAIKISELTKPFFVAKMLQKSPSEIELSNFYSTYSSSLFKWRILLSNIHGDGYVEAKKGQILSEIESDIKKINAYISPMKQSTPSYPPPSYSQSSTPTQTSQAISDILNHISAQRRLVDELLQTSSDLSSIAAEKTHLEFDIFDQGLTLKYINLVEELEKSQNTAKEREAEMKQKVAELSAGLEVLSQHNPNGCLIQ